MSMGYTNAETESFGPTQNVQSNNTPARSACQQTTRQSRPLTPKPSLLNCLSPTILLEEIDSLNKKLTEEVTVFVAGPGLTHHYK